MASIPSTLTLPAAGKCAHQEVLVCVFHMESVSPIATHASVLLDFTAVQIWGKHRLTKNMVFQFQVAPTGTSS